MDSSVILSINLRRIRKKYGFSQEELAARSDLSTRSYGKIERGEVQASLRTMDKLSIGTNLSVSDLLKEGLILTDRNLDEYREERA